MTNTCNNLEGCENLGCDTCYPPEADHSDKECSTIASPGTCACCDEFDAELEFGDLELCEDCHRDHETHPIADVPALTEREREMIVHICHNEYTDGSPFAGTYAFVVCGDKSGAAVFGSLVKKGLADSSEYELDPTTKELFVELTALGRVAYGQIRRADKDLV